MADYDDTGFDAVESPDADLDAVSGISSTDASKTVAAAKVVEENDPLDSPQAKQSNDVADADQFVRMARWRPFMHLFHDCATSTHLDKNRVDVLPVLKHRDSNTCCYRVEVSHVMTEASFPR